MLEIITKILIPIITVTISVVISVIIATMRNRAELAKIQTELEQRYAKSLFDKRIEVYPELHSLLNGYAKLIDQNKLTVKNLLEFKNKFDEWDKSFSLFFTPRTSILSSRFKAYLKILLQDHTATNIASDDWQFIRTILSQFVMALKDEIGVFDTKPVGELNNIEGVYRSVDKRIELLSQ